MARDLTAEEVNKFLFENIDFVEKWIREHNVQMKCYITEEDIKKFTARTFVTFIQDVLDKKSGVRLRSSGSVTERFRETLQTVASELEIGPICCKILKDLCILINCEKASIFMAHGTENAQYLASVVFDVTQTSSLEQTIQSEDESFRIPFGVGIAGYVAEHKMLLNVPDAYNDSRFLDAVDKATGFKTRNILCAPILDRSNNLLGVAQLLNKKYNQDFKEEDEITFETYMLLCSIGLTNFAFYESTFKEIKRHKLLLKLSRTILKYHDKLQDIISEIMKMALEVLECEKINVILENQSKRKIYPDLSYTVYELRQGMSVVKSREMDTQTKNAIKINRMSGHSVQVIKMTNDCKQDSNIIQQVDNETGRLVLCSSLKDKQGEYLGSILYYKKCVNIFGEYDLVLVRTFASFCGLAIYNYRLYEKTKLMLEQLDFTNSLLSNHITCTTQAVNYYMNLKHDLPYHELQNFGFDDFIYSVKDTILFSVRMFLDFKVDTILNIPHETLYRFILTVEKNYRPLIYHNWRHAINVAQMMYCLLRKGNLKRYFTEFEQICLMVAALCHDIDHRGTNNAFQINTSSPFSQLYSTSVLENHHVDRCIGILRIESTNLFKNVSSELYKQALQFIEKAILATDLANHFQIRGEFKELIDAGQTSFESLEDRDVLMSMMMTASDLSAITKPWEIQKRVATIVAAEFYEQGDKETSINQPVLPMMDRSKRYELPTMQLGFIDYVCTMLYQLMSDVSSPLKPIYYQMLINREHWLTIANGTEPFDIDMELDKILTDTSNDSTKYFKNVLSKKRESPKEKPTEKGNIFMIDVAIETIINSRDFQYTLKKPPMITASCQTDAIPMNSQSQIEISPRNMQFQTRVPTFNKQSQTEVAPMNSQSLPVKTDDMLVASPSRESQESIDNSRWIAVSSGSRSDLVPKEKSSVMIQTEVLALKECEHFSIFIPKQNLMLTLANPEAKLCERRNYTPYCSQHCHYHHCYQNYYNHYHCNKVLQSHFQKMYPPVKITQKQMLTKDME